ncbi:MAG: polyphosphate polymerase domain-containing protein, partial [Balneolales bacterium]
MTKKLQRQRFEYKYIIHENTARSVRDFLSSYLDLDEFGSAQPGNSYSVHSLYLDSPDLILYKTTINGDKNRYKLRIRFYECEPDSPVFFEIKRRLNNIIIKKRAGLRREAVRWILAGHLPGPEDYIQASPEQRHNISHFSMLLNRLGAVPQVHVSYSREAWINGSNSVRVTMDRHVRSEPQKEFRLQAGMMDPVDVFRNNEVLELKFTDRFPIWFRDLIQIFGLQQGP